MKLGIDTGFGHTKYCFNDKNGKWCLRNSLALSLSAPMIFRLMIMLL